VAAGKDEIRARLLATFRVEAEEHLQAIIAALEALESNLSPSGARAVLDTAFREVHTLKGAARSVSLTDVERVCHALESVLSRLTRGDLELTGLPRGCLREAVDGVARLLEGPDPGRARALIDGLERAVGRPAGEPGGAVAAPGAPVAPAAGWVPRPAPADTIRLATTRLDALLFGVEEIVTPKLAARERVRGARELVDRITGVVRRLEARPSLAARPRASGIGGSAAEVAAEVRALAAQARELLNQLARDERTTTGVVDGLLEEVRRLRMTPASTVLDLLPRMVQDLASEQDKVVELVVQGADLEVDRKVLEALKEPLIHLVRNAIDHGIEPPEMRARAAKRQAGRLAVTVTGLEGNRIAVRVQDDGRGIDLAQVRAAAVRSRLLAPESAEALSDDQALDLVYRPGLSTSPIITNLSGRGLGLAIVKERVERVAGELRVMTEAGAGTTVEMVLPAAVSTFRGLLVQAAAQAFLLSTEAVERVVRVAPAAVQRLEGREAIAWNGQALFTDRLSELLELPAGGDQAAPPPAGPLCVVVRAGEDRIGLWVDEVLGDREVLVKELSRPLIRVRHVSGAGLLGTGELALILRPSDLIATLRDRARPRARPPEEPDPTHRRAVVLVVDDSITTRTMEKNLLEAAGYEVRVAVDGVEAWTLLKSEAIDLVVSDVDMPRMDGLALTERIRGDRALADLPVVLVTALESREDKERGIEVGANAYIVKSSFDQSNLLEIVGRLV
jgi:two-component system chemotaxis sensor kinase CheA